MRIQVELPDVCLVCFDNIDFNFDCVQRLRIEIKIDLAKIISGDLTIIYESPSVLMMSLKLVDVVNWVGPYFDMPISHLFKYLFRILYKTRPDLTACVSATIQQYWLNWLSLLMITQFKTRVPQHSARA